VRVLLTPVVEDLPVGFDILRAEARAEGYRFLDRLATDWEAGATRFAGEGEALLAASVDRELAGIGGLTGDPIVPDCLRMRRFYIRAAFRRSGVGRVLAATLLGQPERRFRPVTVNAAAGSAAFWESLGFVADARDGHSHILIAS
jgi:GNAT superfamily N-acetyltransferase